MLDRFEAACQGVMRASTAPGRLRQHYFYRAVGQAGALVAGWWKLPQHLTSASVQTGGGNATGFVLSA
jgi:hypothetical protein